MLRIHDMDAQLQRQHLYHPLKAQRTEHCGRRGGKNINSRGLRGVLWNALLDTTWLLYSRRKSNFVTCPRSSHSKVPHGWGMNFQASCQQSLSRQEGLLFTLTGQANLGKDLWKVNKKILSWWLSQRKQSILRQNTEGDNNFKSSDWKRIFWGLFLFSIYVESIAWSQGLPWITNLLASTAQMLGLHFSHLFWLSKVNFKIRSKGW